MKKEETVGKRLRKARLKSGLSLEDVYKNLKIHTKILESLEEDNIDPSIGEIYIKGFLKKYARFLGFEADKIVSDFTQKISIKEPNRENLINIGGEERNSPFIVMDRFNKSILPLIVASFAFIFTLSIIGYAGSRLIAEFKKFRPAVSNASAEKTAKIDKSRVPLFIPRNEPLELRVETKDRVWVRVKSDGNTIFKHTLPEGSIEKWHAKKELELWVGRAEALVLTLNNKSLKLPVRGRVKSIVINHEGLRIAEK